MPTECGSGLNSTTNVCFPAVASPLAAGIVASWVSQHVSISHVDTFGVASPLRGAP